MKKISYNNEKRVEGYLSKTTISFNINAIGVANL